MDVMGYSILACKNALVLLLLTITGHVFTKTYKCVNFPYSKLVIEVPRINLQPQIRYNLMNYELLFFVCACNLNMYNKFERWMEEVSATLKFSDDGCFLAFGSG